MTRVHVRAEGEACRYVVQKIQAAVRGEAQPEKTSTTACSQAKAPQEDWMSSEKPALIPQPADEVVKQECGS
ncbi:hypothetical protein D9C73_001866 [Collichthys lucidus]|uniref:Uncharacterized protein n=1 Tax=Collichthys lucidus TaxID=240159 RepID=A0A4U5U0J5_COLLU|nr:hypothetical protein D9C73_001866 [Collichthys lucidus]